MNDDPLKDLLGQYRLLCAVQAVFILICLVSAAAALIAGLVAVIAGLVALAAIAFA
jgi:hypothetical protein